jgi:diguanylate cyclase (GGDEF)-like protein
MKRAERMNIKKKIFTSMIVLTIGCGIAVLLSSIGLFSHEINQAMHEKNDIAENVIMNEINRLKTQAYTAALGVASTDDLISAIENDHRGQIHSLASAMKEMSRVDYCTVIDGNGIVLVRTHDPDSFGDSVTHLPHVRAALDGNTEAHFIQEPTVLLGMSAAAPVYNRDMEIIGAVSLGFTLNNLEYAGYLKSLTDCEVSFFYGGTCVASTLLFEDGTLLEGTAAPPHVTEHVFTGEKFVTRADIYERNLLSKYIPLHGETGNVVGMVFIGNHTEAETGKILFFAVVGTLITLAVLVICLVIAELISIAIEQRLNSMVKGIETRDGLLQAVNQAAALLLGIDEDTDIKVPLTAGMERVCRSMDADRVHIWRIVKIENDYHYYCDYNWFNESTRRKADIPAMLLNSRGMIDLDWNEKFLRGEFISGPVADMPVNYQLFLRTLDVQSIAIIPLFLDGQLWGVFAIDNWSRVRNFSEEEIEILRSVSLMMANAIKHHALNAEMKESNERVMLMLDASPLCTHIWDKNFNTIDCNDAAVRLFGFKNKQEYINNFITTCSPDYQPDGQRSNVKTVMLVNKAFRDGQCSFSWMHKMPFSSTPIPAEVTLVRVKYHGDDVVIGYTRDMREITKMERKIVRLEAENKKIYYDALTGIFNRRYFDETIVQVLRSLARTNGVLSIMMIDIDFFKNYNDTYGHGEGDECLKQVAAALSECIGRVHDFIARYGGEEFIVVMPNTDESGAVAIADKMLMRIQECGIPHENSEAAGHVTVSIGVSVGRVDRNHSADVFVRLADEMLYLSKQNGRNQYNSERL